MELFVRNKRDELIASVECTWDDAEHAVPLPPKLVIASYAKDPATMGCVKEVQGVSPRLLTVHCSNERAKKLGALGGYLAGRQKAAVIMLPDGSRIVLSHQAPAKTDSAGDFSPDSPRIGAGGTLVPYDAPGSYGGGGATGGPKQHEMRGAHYPTAASVKAATKPPVAAPATALSDGKYRGPGSLLAPAPAVAEPAKKALPSWAKQKAPVSPRHPPRLSDGPVPYSPARRRLAGWVPPPPARGSVPPPAGRRPAPAAPAAAGPRRRRPSDRAPPPWRRRSPWARP